MITHLNRIDVNDRQGADNNIPPELENLMLEVCLSN